MSASNDHICYHERLRPTTWNQSKPKPCAMVSHAGPWGKINWYCPICDWGWDSPTEPQERMTRIIEKAARSVFGKEATDAM